MGRSSGGGGGHHSSGGGRHVSHSSSGGYRSSGSHSSSHSYGSSRSYSSRPVYRSSPTYYHSGGNRSYTTNVGGTGCGCAGCSSYIFVGLIILLLFMIICSSTGNTTIGGGYLIEDAVADSYAESVRKEVFGNDEAGAVFLISEVDNWEDEYITFAMGSKASTLLGKYKEDFYNAYERHYSDDVAYQVREALYDMLDLMEAEGEYAISSSGSYKGQKFIEDKVNAFDTKSKLANAMEDFYKSTGIKLYVIAANYEVFGPTNGAVPEQGTDFGPVLIVLIICVAVVLVIWLLFKWWQAKKKQKNIEDENTIKILNAPLQTFGDSELGDIAKKYDDK